MDVTIPEPALLRLVAGFLRERGLHRAADDVLKEAAAAAAAAGEPVDVERLLVAGAWDELETALQEAAAGNPPTLSTLLWHVRRQRFLEQAHAAATASGGANAHGAETVSGLVAQLAGLEAVAPSPAAFHALAYTLSLPAVAQHPDYAGWSPLAGRTECLSALLHTASEQRMLPLLQPQQRGAELHSDAAALPPPGQLVALLAQAARAQVAAAAASGGAAHNAPLTFDPCAPLGRGASAAPRVTAAPQLPPALTTAHLSAVPASRRPSTALPLPVTPPRISPVAGGEDDGVFRAPVVPTTTFAAAASRPSSAASSGSGHSSGLYHRKNASSIVLGTDDRAFADAMAAATAGSPGRGAAARAAAAAAAAAAVAPSAPTAGAYGTQQLQQRPHLAPGGPAQGVRRGSTVSTSAPSQPESVPVALSFSPPRARPRRAAPAQPSPPHQATASPDCGVESPPAAASSAVSSPTSQVAAYLQQHSERTVAPPAAAVSPPAPAPPRSRLPQPVLPRPSSAASASSVWWSIPFDGPPADVPEPPAAAASTVSPQHQQHPFEQQAPDNVGTGSGDDDDQRPHEPPATSAPVPPQEWFGDGGNDGAAEAEAEAGVSAEATQVGVGTAEDEPADATQADVAPVDGGDGAADSALAATSVASDDAAGSAAAEGNDGTTAFEPAQPESATFSPDDDAVVGTGGAGVGGVLSLSQLAWMEGELAQQVELMAGAAEEDEAAAPAAASTDDAGGDGAGEEAPSSPADEYGADAADVGDEQEAEQLPAPAFDAVDDTDAGAAAAHEDDAAADAPAVEAGAERSGGDEEADTAAPPELATPPAPLPPLRAAAVPLGAYTDAQPVRAVTWCGGAVDGCSGQPLLVVGTNSRALKALSAGDALSGAPAPAAGGALPGIPLPAASAALNALHLGSVYAIATCDNGSDGVLLATCSNDTTVKVTRLSTAAAAGGDAAAPHPSLHTLATLQPALSTLRDVCWLRVPTGGGQPDAPSPSRLLLACAGGGDFSVKVYDLTAVADAGSAQLPSTAVAAVLSGHSGVVHSLRALPAAGPGGLVSASADGTLRVWDVAAACAGGEAPLATWDVGGALRRGQGSGQLAAGGIALSTATTELHSLALLPAAADGAADDSCDAVAVGTSDGHVVAVDVRAGVLLAAARVHTGEVRSVHAAAAAVALRDDVRRTLVLSASFDGTVAVSQLLPLAEATEEAPALREVARVRHGDKALCCRWWQPGGGAAPTQPSLLALPAHFATSGADRRAVVWRLEEQSEESVAPA